MQTDEPIKPRDRLLAVAALWSEATGRSTGALSSLVSNHGGTLDRLRDPAIAVTDLTIEKFARFLTDASNWPDDAVPQEAHDLAHVTGVSADGGSSSPGNGSDLSPEAEANPGCLTASLLEGKAA